jgi:DNA-binding MarR family transcriptional regulator
MLAGVTPPHGKPPPRNVLLQLFILGQLAGTLLGREFARDGVDRSSYAVLTTIGAYGPATPTELATLLGMPLTTLSAAVAKLGPLVERSPHPTDGRSHLLELTEAGREAALAGQPALRRALDAVHEAAGGRVAELEQALLELQEVLRAALDDAPIS